METKGTVGGGVIGEEAGSPSREPGAVRERCLAPSAWGPQPGPNRKNILGIEEPRKWLQFEATRRYSRPSNFSLGAAIVPLVPTPGMDATGIM